MRAYFFGNMYLSSIQQGIQAQHCTAELFVKYNHPFRCESKANADLFDWAENHKTSILLNGGDSGALQEIVDLMNTNRNPYPWAPFRESTEALNSVRTCVGIILPELVYESVAFWRQRDFEWNIGLSEWEEELVKVVGSCGLAR